MPFEPTTIVQFVDTPGAEEASGSPEAASPRPKQTNAQADEAKRYARESLRCTLLDMGIDVAVLGVVAGGLGAVIDAALSNVTGLQGSQSVVRGALLGATITLLHAAVSLPLSFYAGFVVEHRYGLSKQTLGRWVQSWIKRTVLTTLMLTLLYTGLLAIMWWVGWWWWLVAAGVFFATSALLGQLAPVLLVPLFYKVERLEAGDTTARMSKMASAAGLTIEGVYRLGLSAETAKGNAMLAGLGSTRRVLMGDTLLDAFSPEEIDVVFAHELGHHARRHLPKMLFLSGVAAVAGLAACHVGLSAWTGIGDPADWPNTVLPPAVFLLTLFSLAIGPLQGLYSRRMERQADRYALDATGNPAAFRSAFLKLARINKVRLDPGPIEVFALHSHPPIRERLAAAEAWQAAT